MSKKLKVSFFIFSTGLLIVLLFALAKNKELSEQVKVEVPQSQSSISPEQNRHTLQGYLNSDSFSQGSTADLHVHAPLGEFNLQIVKLGLTNKKYFENRDVVASRQHIQNCAFSCGANWSVATTFQVGKWESGIYDAVISDSQSTFHIPFVVKPTSSDTSDFIVLANTYTWQAYNSWGGGSLYLWENPELSETSNPPVISLLRPNPAASPEINNGHLLGGELHLLKWLEENGFSFAVISDSDLDNETNPLAGRNNLILNTHPEYWTDQMHLNFASFQQAGGNTAYLAGNGLYWKTVVKNGQLEVRKDQSLHQIDGSQGGLWRGFGRNESGYFGVSFSGKGFGTYAPYEVLDASHWVYEGTKLKTGDLFGVSTLTNHAWTPGTETGASGWETDQVTEQSPKDLTNLARGTNAEGGADMVHFISENGGHVFSVGSIAFTGALSLDPYVSQIVKNVLNKFLEQ